jgi:hypothetical protein
VAFYKPFSGQIDSGIEEISRCTIRNAEAARGKAQIHENDYGDYQTLQAG